MLGLGIPELVIILVIVMVIFGVGKLPQIGSALGKSIKEFKKETTAALPEETAEEPMVEAAAAPAAEAKTES